MINNQVQQPYKQLHNIVAVGDAEVGKSSIIDRIMRGSFKQNYDPTIGIDFKMKYYNNQEYQARYTIWDTSGNKKFKQISRNYYRNCRCFFLVFALDNRQSFLNLITEYLPIVNQYSRNDIDCLLILLGNKSDKEDRKVTTSQANILANDRNMTYFEISAKNNTNIQQFFNNLHLILSNKYKRKNKLTNRGQTIQKNEKQQQKLPAKQQKKQLIMGRIDYLLLSLLIGLIVLIHHGNNSIQL